MKSFLAHVELWLSGVALLIVFIVPSWIVPPGHDIWKATAITAIGVGTLHGIIFWVIRRRQRSVRNVAIREMRGMLTDKINNQLTELMLSTSASGASITTEQERVATITRCASRISMLLKSLSEESLQNWKTQHAEMLTGLAAPTTDRR